MSIRLTKERTRVNNFIYIRDWKIKDFAFSNEEQKNFLVTELLLVGKFYHQI